MQNSTNKQEEYICKLNQKLSKNTKILKKNIVNNKVKEDLLEVTKKAVSYSDIISKELAKRHSIINDLLEDLIDPLKNEQKSKVKYRKTILIAFSIYFVVVTFLFFGILFCFMQNGYTEYETKVSIALITGFFVNIIGLVVIIFKYLFDDKNSLMKDMIKLITETLKNNNLKI